MSFKILKKCFSYFLPVKDKLHEVGGVKNFVIDHNLQESCKTAHARSQAGEEKNKWGKLKKSKRQRMKQERKQKSNKRS